MSMLSGCLALTVAALFTGAADAGPKTRKLLVKWNNLHAVRTALGALATASFIVGLSQ